jgi:hypothetical protein
MQLVARAEDHSRIGLAIERLASIRSDPVFGMVRTEVHRVEVRTFAGELLTHPRREGMKLLLGVVPAGNARLIRHDDNRVARRTEPAAQRVNAGDELERLAGVNVTAIDVDDAVTIQEERRT